MEPINKPPLIRQARPFHQGGFTLVEIMVGLVIGLLTTLVIMQVFAVYEAQKRTTTGIADAQTSGSTALYTIGRELQVAGYPLMPVTNSPLECTTLTFGATGIGGIFPTTITDGGTAAGASDTITLRYGNSAMGGVPTQISAMGTPTANDATVANNLGCRAGDIAIVVGSNLTCAMTSVTAVSGVVAPMTVTLQNTTAATLGANLACLGDWNEIAYSVQNGNLMRNPNPAVAASAVPVVPDIVNLQAQYGISEAGLLNTNPLFNQVTRWVDATAANGWNAPTIINRNRIKAIRIAVVARNGLLEKTNVTTTAPIAWEGSASSPAPTVDLSSVADWERYRYRVFETIIPLRNVIWSRDTL